jgi:hypothetical protein
MSFKAGSEILPVSSGAGKPKVLRLSKLDIRQARSQNLIVAGKALSLPFCAF